MVRMKVPIKKQKLYFQSDFGVGLNANIPDTHIYTNKTTQFLTSVVVILLGVL